MEVFTLEGITVYKWHNQSCRTVYRRLLLASESSRALGCVRIKQRLYAVLNWKVYEYRLDCNYKVKQQDYFD